MTQPTWPESDATDDPRFRRYDPPAPDNTWLWLTLVGALMMAVLTGSIV